VIVSINRQAVATTAQVGAAVDAARRSGRTAVLLLVRRGQTPGYFVGVDLAK
jgi:serine protease Do